MDGESFKVLRKGYGKSQDEIAKMLDKSRLTIINWESGKYRIPADIGEQLLKAGIALPAASAASQKPVCAKTHPHLYTKIGPDNYVRNHLHPHWYVTNTTLARYLTEEQQAQAKAFVTLPEHVEGHTPMTGPQAVAFLQSLGVPENAARYTAEKTGFSIAGMPATITEADLLF